MPTHTLNVSLGSDSGSAAVSQSCKEAGSSEIVIDKQFPAASADVAQAMSFTASALRSIILLSDKNMTIKTNSAGSPANTFNLVAGIPLIWQVSAGYTANPFTSNVTGLYVSCTPSARLKIKALIA